MASTEVRRRERLISRLRSQAFEMIEINSILTANAAVEKEKAKLAVEGETLYCSEKSAMSGCGQYRKHFIHTLGIKDTPSCFYYHKLNNKVKSI